MSDDTWQSYDEVKIDVDPPDLKDKAKRLALSVKAVGALLSDVNDVLTGLKLNWAGQTSEEYDEITAEWKRVVDMAFGTEKEPETGALNAIATGVSRAASNFAGAELATAKMFDEMLYSLGPNIHSDDAPSPPKDSLDSDFTAVSTNYASDYSEGDKENEEAYDRAKANGFVSGGYDEETDEFGPDLDAYVGEMGGINTPDGHQAAVDAQNAQDQAIKDDYSKYD